MQYVRDQKRKKSSYQAQTGISVWHQLRGFSVTLDSSYTFFFFIVALRKREQRQRDETTPLNCYEPFCSLRQPLGEKVQKKGGKPLLSSSLASWSACRSFCVGRELQSSGFYRSLQRKGSVTVQSKWDSDSFRDTEWSMWFALCTISLHPNMDSDMFSVWLPRLKGTHRGHCHGAASLNEPWPHRPRGSMSRASDTCDFHLWFLKWCCCL